MYTTICAIDFLSEMFIQFCVIDRLALKCSLPCCTPWRNHASRLLSKPKPAKFFRSFRRARGIPCIYKLHNSCHIIILSLVFGVENHAFHDSVGEICVFFCPLRWSRTLKQFRTRPSYPSLSLPRPQGIDVCRHLPSDALGDLMDLSRNSGVQLSTVYVSRVEPFSATLMAKVPQRDSETFPSPTATTATAAAANSSDPASGKSEEAWIDGGAAAAAASAAAAATAADKGFEKAGEAGSDRETPVSPSIPGTTMGSGYGRPRVGVSKIAETDNAFEALGLALRYPSTKIFVRADLLASSGGGGGGSGGGAGGGGGAGKVGSSTSSFDSADVAELYPNLMKLKDAKTRRSSSDDMNTQFEMQKIRQQLESAVSDLFIILFPLLLSFFFRRRKNFVMCIRVYTSIFTCFRFLLRDLAFVFFSFPPLWRARQVLRWHTNAVVLKGATPCVFLQLNHRDRALVCNYSGDVSRGMLGFRSVVATASAFEGMPCFSRRRRR